MTVERSRALMIEAPSSGREQHLAAYGEPDDHLRLAVLLARRIQERDTRADRDAVQVCETNTSTWRERREALTRLLRGPGASGLTFVDIDALNPGPLSPKTRWDDSTFAFERRQLLDDLAVAAARGAWTLLRPVRNAEVTMRLQDEGVPVESAPPAEARSEVELGRLSPELRPLARWLLRTSIISPKTLSRTLATSAPRELDQHLIAMVYDTMGGAARDAAFRLSGLRPEQPLNGVVGPFSLTGQGVSSLERRDVEALQDCGFLQVLAESPAESLARGSLRVRMPRLVRHFLVRRRKAVYPEQHRADHLRFAALDNDSHDAAQVIEAHNHAIQGGDVERALSTATYYGSDLRGLAYRLSRDRQYAEAAKLYRCVVDRYDNLDSYAWEYLAFNLYLDHERQRRSWRDTPVREEVEAAYRKAHDLEPGNPLYHGRLLGFQAHMGQDIVPAFRSGLRAIEGSLDERGVSFFVKPILDGVKRGRRRALRAQLLEVLGARIPYLRKMPELKSVL